MSSAPLPSRTTGGAGLTVLLDALPIDDRIILVEPKIDPDQIAGLQDAPPVPPKTAP